MNIHSLARELDKLCEQLDDKYDINCGGCCYICWQIARHLERLGLKYNLVLYNESVKHEDRINYEIKHMSKSNLAWDSVVDLGTCYHYCIQIRGSRRINSGDYSKDLFKYVIKDVTFKHIRWIYKNGSWNEFYNTKNNVAVRKLISEFFKKYETSKEQK